MKVQNNISPCPRDTLSALLNVIIWSWPWSFIHLLFLITSFRSFLFPSPVESSQLNNMTWLTFLYFNVLLLYFIHCSNTETLWRIIRYRISMTGIPWFTWHVAILFHCFRLPGNMSLLYYLTPLRDKYPCSGTFSLFIDSSVHGIHSRSSYLEVWVCPTERSADICRCFPDLA